MKHLFLLGSLCGVLILTHTNSKAQGKTEKNIAGQKQSHWVIGTTYQSNDVYLGRKDSIVVPYFTPSIGYYDKSGFFTTGSLSYLPGSGENRVDIVSIEGGYKFTSDDFNAEFSAAKDFYSDKSFAVSSEIKGRLSAYLSYDFGFVQPSLDLGVDFSDKPDVGLGLGIEHSFSVIEDQFEINPAFHLNVGTQNYYGSYYNKRRYSSKRKNRNISSSVSASLANASKFQIMDYEFGVPVEYTIRKKLKLNFTPTVALPVNPAIVTLATKSSGRNITTQSSRESLSSTFYFSIGFSYTF